MKNVYKVVEGFQACKNGEFQGMVELSPDKCWMRDEDSYIVEGFTIIDARGEVYLNNFFETKDEAEEEIERTLKIYTADLYCESGWAFDELERNLKVAVERSFKKLYPTLVDMMVDLKKHHVGKDNYKYLGDIDFIYWYEQLGELDAIFMYDQNRGYVVVPKKDNFIVYEVKELSRENQDPPQHFFTNVLPIHLKNKEAESNKFMQSIFALKGIEKECNVEIDKSIENEKIYKDFFKLSKPLELENDDSEYGKKMLLMQREVVIFNGHVRLFEEIKSCNTFEGLILQYKYYLEEERDNL